MKLKIPIIVSTLILFAVGAWAQDQDEAPKVEVTINYSYFRYNPSHAFTQGHSLNGAGGSIGYNLSNYLGLKAEFEGYGSYGYNFVIPVGSPLLPVGGTIHANGNLFTYLFGPTIGPHTGRVRPFGEALFGGAHSNVYANLFTLIGSASAAPSGNGFAMAVGGGVDFALSHHFSIRPAQFDYVLTRFNNSVTGNQSNFRYQAGAVFNF
jgi:outer membrane immunogenic protein